MDIDNRLIIALSIVVLLNILYSSKLEHLEQPTYTDGNTNLYKLNISNDLSVDNNATIRGSVVDFGTEKSKKNQMLTMGLGGSYIRPVPATAHQWDVSHDLASGNLSIGECYNDPAKPAGSQWTCVNKVVLNGKNGAISLNGDISLNGKISLNGEVTANGNVITNGNLQVNGDLSNTRNATFASDPTLRGKTRVNVGTDMSVANTLLVRDALLLGNSGTNTWAFQHKDVNPGDDINSNLIISPYTITTDANGYLKPTYDEGHFGALKLNKTTGMYTPNIHAQYGVYAPSLVLQKKKADGKLGEIYLRARDETSIEYYDMKGRTPFILDNSMINPVDPQFNKVTTNLIYAKDVDISNSVKLPKIQSSY